MQRLQITPLLALLFFLLSSAFASAPLPAQRGFHVEPSLGFKFRVPPGWKRWPAEKDRRFVRGFYVASKPLTVRGLGSGHRPTLRVIVLPKAGTGTGGTANGQAQGAPPAEGQAAASSKKAPAKVSNYADYKDYLTRNLSGFLLYQSTKDTTVAGRPCVQYRIRRRTKDHAYQLHVWVLDFENHAVAIEFLVHEKHASKQERLFQAAIKSLRLQEPDPKADTDPWRPPLWQRDPERWKKLSLKDRISVRAKFERELIERVRGELAPGFKVKQTKHFLVVSAADARFTTAISKAADSCFQWCEDHLGGVSDESVIRGVLRVFPNRTDEYVYRSRSAQRSRFVPSIREVIVSPGRRAPKELTGPGDLNRAVLHLYLEDKVQGLHDNLPAWLRDGLRNVLYLSKLARGKLAFEVSDYERQVVREARRGEVGATIKAIVQQRLKLPANRRRDRQVRYHRGRAVRFLMQASSGRRPLVAKTFFADYLIAVAAAQENLGVKPRNPGAGSVPGWTEEDGEAAGESREKARLELLESVGQVAVPWSTAEWQAIEKAYLKFNKTL